MKNLSIKRFGVSKENIAILQKLFLGNIDEGKKSGINMEYRKEENIDKNFQDSALGVLYKNMHENKTSQKPLIYFFIGLIVGVLATLFLTAVVFVSDKDTIENDVKSIKETIIENENINDLNNNETGEKVSEASGIAASQDLNINENGQKIYTVKEGDTLGGIVNRLYGLTYDPQKVEKFKEANDLKSIHKLKIGQELVVPD